MHEIGHVFANDRDLNLQDIYRNDLPREFRTNFFPTRYANNRDPREYMIEAITGVWWNSGYVTIPGYDSSAGGRTALIDMAFADREITSAPNYATDDPDDTFPLVLLNVDSQIWEQIGAETTLQDWILANVIQG